MDARQGSSAANVNDHGGSSGSYVLRELIKDIPLSTDEDGTQAYITCVDSWNGNLYIGTSAGEVLRYVSIPPDPSDESGEATYIFATKLEPPYTTKQKGQDAGVKQILLLPDEGKACILCNAALTFYTLPELSPAFGEKIKQSGCLWVGGSDLNQSKGGAEDRESNGDGTVIVICLKQRLRLIRIAEKATKVRDIELGNVSAIQRRGDLACVADGNTYALLDVVNHRKNDLFPISSLSAPLESAEKPLPEIPQPSSRRHTRTFSAAIPSRQGRSHERNESLGAQPKDDSSSPFPPRSSSRHLLSPAQPSSREESPAAKPDDASPRRSIDAQAKSEPAVLPRPLPPNISSPSPNEFLLTMGTQLSESGVGISSTWTVMSHARLLHSAATLSL